MDDERIILEKEKAEKERLTNLLVKEEFRTFAKENKIGDRCVIDSSDYVEVPGMVGCFRHNGRWVVYEVGDHSEPFGEIVHSTAEKAFRDMAERCGKKFVPSGRRGVQEIEAARRNLIEVNKNLQELKINEDKIMRDILFLSTFLRSKELDTDLKKTLLDIERIQKQIMESDSRRKKKAYGFILIHKPLKRGRGSINAVKKFLRVKKENKISG